MAIEKVLTEERFDFISDDNKAFITAFDKEIEKLGYDFSGEIGSGVCWGKYMIIYRKTGVKNKQVSARIYIRENSIVLRMFFNKIDKHREYIENAPAHIKTIFTQKHGDCNHCEGKKDNKCSFRKTYTIEDRLIEKCSGVVFEFHNPNLEKLSDYIDLLSEFYASKRKKINEIG